MNTDKNADRGWRSFICVYLCSSVVLFSVGCGGPNKANIALRKQNQDLTARVDDLKRQHEADVATIVALQQQRGTLATLPQDRLERLFTAHDIRIERLTGGADLDTEKPGDE